MPRILDTRRCPRCKGDVGRPTPRVCPHCGGSLQQRFLSWGCFTTAPPVLAIAVGAAWLLLG